MRAYLAAALCLGLLSAFSAGVRAGPEYSWP